MSASFTQRELVTEVPAGPGLELGLRGAMRLARLHSRILILESLRVPIAVVSSLVFPLLVLLFFVVPFGYPAEVATASLAQLALFAMISSFVFNYGATIAEERSRSWDPYLRTLPAGAAPRIVGRLITGIVFGLLGLVPMGLLAMLATAATLPLPQLLIGVSVLLVAGLPFLFIGLVIGYSLSSKAAIAVAQLVLFPSAFVGGLFIPPQVFPNWLDTISMLTPARGGRDLMVWAVGGAPPAAATLTALGAWTVAGAAAAAWAYRRDEGRRFS